MFNNLYGVSSCVWEQMDTGRHVYQTYGTYETVYRISRDINYANEPVYQQRPSLFDIVWDFLVLGASIATLS